MAPGRKTGGRIKGVSKNKPKPQILPPGSAEAIYASETARVVSTLIPTNIRTPKAVILDAMVRWENLGVLLLGKAERMAKTKADPDKISTILQEANKCVIAAVQCATAVAPYIHARLLAIESRGDMTDDKAPYVVRAPFVVENSEQWAAMVAQQGVALDKAEREAVREAVLQRWPEVQATSRQPLVENNAPRASGVGLEGMPHPAMPSGSAETDVSPMPTPLRADPERGRIGPAEPTPTVAPSPRMMPVGPVVVKPSVSEEWLEAVARDRAKKVG